MAKSPLNKSTVIWQRPVTSLVHWRMTRLYRYAAIETPAGAACVFCGLAPEIVIEYKQLDGSVHRDPFAVVDKGYRLFTVDHILPKSLGGAKTPQNLRPACYLCNDRRATVVSEQDIAYLRTQPLALVCSIPAKLTPALREALGATTEVHHGQGQEIIPHQVPD